MSNLSKEVLRNYITEQNFQSSGDVLAAMKDMFRDVLQEALGKLLFWSKEPSGYTVIFLNQYTFSK